MYNCISYDLRYLHLLNYIYNRNLITNNKIRLNHKMLIHEDVDSQLEETFNLKKLIGQGFRIS